MLEAFALSNPAPVPKTREDRFVQTMAGFIRGTDEDGDNVIALTAGTRLAGARPVGE